MLPPFIRSGSPKSRTSPYTLTPPRGSPTPVTSSARSHSLILDRRPSINSSYPSRDSVSLESPQPTDDPGAPAGDDSIFEFEEEGPREGYYLSANTFDQLLDQQEDDDDEVTAAVVETRIQPIPSRSEGFALSSSLPISIPQPLKFTPHGGSVTNRGLTSGSSSTSASGSSCSCGRTSPSGSGSNRGMSSTSARRPSRPDTDEDRGVVNMVLPPHTIAEGATRSRKGSEKDAEELFEHAVRFQSLSLKTRTYL